ncbi:hypothetical protein M3M38_05140 [Fructilactobacillus cliffordii]|uniref:hypothetical protein n=1 Tax=Fructilactobacillus cliffordii TaxID=2940299 RepID=UPI002093DEBF|nr:hypothetical protein [Fructilactobacillus cliffordii]USS86085.1 hypothetical protein M3M38_05140 [Fructilactobacillus cliffordii]
MKIKRLTWWTLLTLGCFLLLNAVLSLGIFRSSVASFWRSEIAAVVMILLPLAVAWLGIRLGLYVLALVQALYVLGYCNAVYRLIQLPHLGLPVRLGGLVLVVGALGVLLYWFRLAWQVRQSLTKERVQRYLKFRK